MSCERGGGLDSGSNDGGGGKWSYCECILKMWRVASHLTSVSPL